MDIYAEQKKLFGLNQNQLKIIAVISMVIDHVGAEIFPEIRILRYIGRLAFPIFAYFIYEGCKYTHNKLEYLERVFGMGVLCIIGYYIYSKEIYGNILITFSLSICVIYSIQFLKERIRGSYSDRIVAMGLFLLCLFAVYAVCKIIEVDYGFVGVLVPAFAEIFNWTSENKKYRQLLGFGIGLLILAINLGGSQYFALVTLLLLAFYNGSRGKKNMQQFFYWFYPINFVIIGEIAALM